MRINESTSVSVFKAAGFFFPMIIRLGFQGKRAAAQSCFARAFYSMKGFYPRLQLLASSDLSRKISFRLKSKSKGTSRVFMVITNSLMSKDGLVFKCYAFKTFFGVSGCSIYRSASDARRKIPCTMKNCIFLYNRCLDVGNRSAGKSSGIKVLPRVVKSRWSPKPILQSEFLVAAISTGWCDGNCETRDMKSHGTGTES